ncbi:MAG: 1,4-alpha-glucan-branching enzyme [Bacteroidetes bacterium]|nr:MAG: 1,4-alpha-glucan-branching enzyme [Bacteroidota bacterium]
MQERRLKLVKEDPWLEPVEREINDRYRRFRERLHSLETDAGSLSRFADGYHYFGITYDRKQQGWFYREWAPHAEDLYLFGDFNDWQRYANRLTRLEGGIWELFLPEDKYRDRFTHQSKIKVLVHSDMGWEERIPAWIRRVVQDPGTLDYAGQVWMPPHPFNWEGDHFSIGTLKELIIYETHVGMAQERAGVGTFVEFADYLIHYIKNAGYNTIQLMAIAEHPYYGSFGYHVTNFFAVSSRFGTPEELKYLIKKAHEQDIAVIMDLVHSHAAKNTLEGINNFDGSGHQYFHSGERGNHPHWDSKIFDYGKWEVLRFLLSNVKFWLKEFHFDGFRFDGITSMIYFDHGFREVWDLDGYFRSTVEWDAITYLQLANTLVHRINPEAVTISEDVSGMPGMCRQVREGGIGFDYRLGMAIPDYWIRILKEKRDEEWNIHELWSVLNERLSSVKTIAYCESHDQALVGDQTIAFRLMQAEIYFKMSKRDQSVIIDRGLALHKMIRLITITLGGQAYLNFMGNEFGHPDWIDFPREGNNWSYQYARRQWSLRENPDLKYHYLSEFDRQMIRLVKSFDILCQCYGKQLNMDEANKTIVFEKQGLIFVFNFHPDRSIPGYSFQVPEPGDYLSVLNTDDLRFGGLGRIDQNQKHITTYDPKAKAHWLSIYNTNRTAQVFRKI